MNFVLAWRHKYLGMESFRDIACRKEPSSMKDTLCSDFKRLRLDLNGCAAFVFIMLFIPIGAYTHALLIFALSRIVCHTDICQ